MATLKQPHWECVSSTLQEIIRYLGKAPFSQRFYLAGGTALALQLGHRTSLGLDFFSNVDELLPQSCAEIISALEQQFVLQILEEAIGRLMLIVEGSHMHFFGYGYPLLAPTVSLEGLSLAGLLDIGLIKMDAIAGRGARKDFYDLYFLAQQIPLDEILERGQEKYPHVRDFPLMVLAAMTDLEFADQQATITSSPPVDWETVKAFFAAEIRRVGQSWFRRES
ncbi:MAG: nucleotidyl transferase AbiEii/AbiGii toxin family protein [Chloroflexia bacterium]|nr:nucleotidyl transferase AbiEii/AbiGii toxin family protein [Chloroflexia bacterium]